MMLGKWQFSLGYLLLEMLWVASALGLLRASVSLPLEYEGIGPLILLAGVVATGAAIGGAFDRMLWGALLIIPLALLFGLLLPAVMVA